MKIYKISNDTNLKKVALKIGVSKEGFKIMKPKTVMNFLYIKDLRNPAANILKQEALSVGAELFVPKGCIICEKNNVDVLLVATDEQLLKISKKLKYQDFGLKNLKLKQFINLKPKKPKIMGVLNVNDDSFNKASRFKGQKAIDRIYQMIEDGASIIDVGALSSRPGSSKIDAKEELSRMKDILDEIYKQNIYEKAIFSLDSYQPLCLEYAFNKGFKITNDIYGLQNEEVAKISAKYNASVCIMHMQNDPDNMQKEPKYDDVISEIDEFFKQRLEIAYKYGIKDVILDVGIGFGKTLEHNLLLLKHHKHFLHYGCELLVGASRKSMIDKISPSSTEERLPGTLALHLEALNNGASIIRVHDVKEHNQALKVWEALRDTNLQENL